METQFIGDDGEIPMWKRDELWKRNLLAMATKFQCGKETNCGNAIQSAELMKFQSRIETIMEMQVNLHL